MNITFGRLRARVALAGLLAAAGISGLGTLTATIGSTPAVASFASPSAPLADWLSPQDVSGQDSGLDTAPVIAAAPNGAVTIAWERQASDSVYVFQRSNTSLNGAFGNIQQLYSSASSGEVGHNIRIGADSQGKRHILWWQPSGTQICGAYSHVDTNGVATTPQILNFTCQSSNFRKNVALAVGPDDSLHVLFGWDQHNIYYSHMTSAGIWDVQNELVIDTGTPKNITIGVNSQLGADNKVMVAWVETASSHVNFSQRLGANSWSAPVNIANSGLCSGPSHGPALARDNSGGMRIVWSQACPSAEEIFYREWTSDGGWSQGYANPSNQNEGNSNQPAIAVDSTGVAHVLWSDDTGRTTDKFRVYYAKGRLSGFTSSGAIFASSVGASNFQKEPSISQNPPGTGVAATIHVAFSSDVSGNKEVYYSNSTSGCTPGRYTDVPPSAYYYDHVYDLGTANPQVMGGYEDCTFHPENNITRGQTAKIVVLGAGLTINTTGGPHFSDVPQSNVFYSYIETAYNAHVISGYTNGTFGPNDNVTRSQFSKMVVLAFQFPINTTGGPHFNDVPNGSTYYGVIETAYNRGLISGYTGGLFKPNDNLIRGQAAKIINLARH